MGMAWDLSHGLSMRSESEPNSFSALRARFWIASPDWRTDCGGLEERVMEPRKLVAVVDDDESIRESLPDLLVALGYAARAFASAEEFLASGCVSDVRCLILDIAMPGMSGPELQRELILQGHQIPIIFITAQGDKSLRRGLLQKGAVECLFKPFSEENLRTALDAALPRI
jgi:FixJ family two-component response regulator